MGECDENGAIEPRENMREGCLTGLIWLDLIIAKEMKSKFGKAVMVIKDVIRSFMSPYLMKRRKHDENDFSKQNKLHRVSPLYWLPRKNSHSVLRGGHLISEVVWAPFHSRESMNQVICQAAHYTPKTLW